MQKQVLQDLQEIIEASFDGILVTDAAGNVELVNQGYVHNTGITRKELLGRNIPQAGQSRMDETVGSGYGTGEEGDRIAQTHDQEWKIHYCDGYPIFDEQKNIKKIVVNSRDISELYAPQ